MIIINSAFGNCRRRVKTRPYCPSPADHGTARPWKQEGGGGAPLASPQGSPAPGEGQRGGKRSGEEGKDLSVSGKEALLPALQDMAQSAGEGGDSSGKEPRFRAQDVMQNPAAREQRGRRKRREERAGTDGIRAAQGLHKNPKCSPARKHHGARADPKLSPIEEGQPLNRGRARVQLQPSSSEARGMKLVYTEKIPQPTRPSEPRFQLTFKISRAKGFASDLQGEEAAGFLARVHALSLGTLPAPRSTAAAPSPPSPAQELLQERLSPHSPANPAPQNPTNPIKRPARLRAGC